MRKLINKIGAVVISKYSFRKSQCRRELFVFVLELALGDDVALGYLAMRGSSSTGDVIFWRLLSEGLMTIVPSCVQQADMPKCCLALLKAVCRVRVKNSLTVKPEPFNAVFALQTAARTSTVENQTSTGRRRSLEGAPMR